MHMYKRQSILNLIKQNKNASMLLTKVPSTTKAAHKNKSK